MKTPYLIAAAAALLILPLAIPLPGIRGTSLGHLAATEWVILGLLATFYLRNLRYVREKLRPFVSLATGISILIILATLLAPASKWPETVRLLLVAWTLPFFGFLILRYGRALFVLSFIGILCLQAQWAVMQFISQADLGMHYIGEARLSATTGVAKFLLVNNKIIRAYGPYSHPNSLAGSIVLISLAAMIWWHTSQYSVNNRPGDRANTSATLPARASSPYGHYVYFAGFPIALAAILTFSRAAYSALIIGLVLSAVIQYIRRSRGPGNWNLNRIRWTLLLPFLIVIIVFSPSLVSRAQDPEDVAIADRLTGYRWAAAIIQQTQWWRGVGVGAYPQALEKFLDEQHITHQPWQLDYVHSVPLLVIAEWGLLVVMLAGLLAILVCSLEHKLPPRHVQLLFLALLPVILFDHYLLTQTAPMVWLMALAAVWYRESPRVKLQPARSAPQHGSQ